MLKKLYFSILLFVSLPLLGMEMPMEMPSFGIANLTNQLNHVNEQIKTAEKAYKKEITRMLRLQQIALEQTPPAPYEKIKEIFEKIINNDVFVANMNATVDQQFESIVNNNAPFKDAENKISDISTKPAPRFNEQLYAAMANKAYYALLGKKLSQKSKELAAIIKATQQAAANSQENLPGLFF